MIINEIPKQSAHHQWNQWHSMEVNDTQMKLNIYQAEITELPKKSMRVNGVPKKSMGNQ